MACWKHHGAGSCGGLEAPALQATASGCPGPQSCGHTGKGTLPSRKPASRGLQLANAWDVACGALSSQKPAGPCRTMACGRHEVVRGNP